ncbi:MAG: tetratricopeptide repeat protein [Candidatus Eremiobacterota bacterium]
MSKKFIITVIVFIIGMVYSLPVQAESADDWIKYGNQLYSQGKYAEAIKYYDAAIGMDANNVRAWTNKGNALYALGRYNEAVTCYDKVLTVDPGNTTARSYKNKILQGQQQQGQQQGQQQQGQQQGADNIIEPGRVGPFQLGGVSLEQVKSALGNPTRIEDNKNASSVVCHYTTQGLILYFSGGYALANVITTSPSYQTRKNIKVGSRIEDVRKAYEGTEVLLSETTQYNYLKNVLPSTFGVYLSYEGIKFIFGQGYSVIGIEIGN